jgi:hypothetical protein
MMTVDQTPQLSPRVLAFHTCELCSYDFRTDEGERSCHYYGCPYLPEELDVWCPTCRYNFMVGDGNPGCSDPPACGFARTVAPGRVRALEAWLIAQGR